MKKILYLAAVAALAFASCAKVEEVKPGGDDPAEEPVDTRVVTLRINDNAAVRSVFSEDALSLTGSESLRICYVGGDGKIAGSVKATGSEWEYTFTLPDGVEADDYTWYAVGPWKSYTYKSTDYTVLQTTTSGVISLPVPAVQTPGDNTIDPAADIIISESFAIEEGEATINRFKRLSAPLQIRVTGLEEGDKIYAVTLEAESDNGLVSGGAPVSLTDDYATAGVTSYTSQKSMVSAIWQNGQAAAGEYWPVWFSVNPTTIAAGADLTLTVTTANKTYVRTVPALATEFVNDHINWFSFNIKGEGYTSYNSIAQGFMTSEIDASLNTGGTKSLVASDGNSYDWILWRGGQGMNTVGYVYDGLVPYAIEFSQLGGTFKGVKVPAIAGAKITGLKVFPLPNTAIASHNLQIFPSDATAGGDFTYLYQQPLSPCVTIENNDEITENGLSGLKLASSSTHNFYMIVLKVEDNIDMNDYYAIYSRGWDITIGDVTVNKTNYPSSSLVLNGEITASSFGTANTVYFVDDTPDDDTDASSVTLMSTLTPGAGAVIIGRYKTSQPTINISGSYVYIRPKNNLIKNMHISSASTGMFSPASTKIASDYEASFTLEDCTLEVTNSSGFVLKEVDNVYKFGDVVFNNSIIQLFSTTLLGASSSGVGMLGKEGSITLQNCVVTPLPQDDVITHVNYGLINVKDKTGDSDEQTFKLVLRNNTFYGLKNAAFIVADHIGGFDIENNIFIGAWGSGTNRILKTEKDQSTKPDPRIMSNNFSTKNGSYTFGTTNSVSQKHWNSDDHNTALSYTNSGNTLTSTSEPFSQIHEGIGYFLVDGSVVTNGAGATYTNKLWRQWYPYTPAAASHEPID